MDGGFGKILGRKTFGALLAQRWQIFMSEFVEKDTANYSGIP